MTPDNGSNPPDQRESNKAICAITIAIAPNGGGVQFQIQPPGEHVERSATHADLTAISAQLSQWCQTQAVLAAMAEQRRQQRILPFGR